MTRADPAHRRAQLPLRPPSLRSTRMSSMRAAGSTALIMSYRVRAATLTAVSASISTPVRSVLRTDRGDLDLRLADREVDVDAGKGELMAQRDQVAGAFGRQYARHPGGRQCIALGQPAGRYQRDHVSGGAQRAGSYRGAPGGPLFGDVDHVRRPPLIQVRQRRPGPQSVLHGPSPGHPGYLPVDDGHRVEVGQVVGRHREHHFAEGR